MFKQRYTPEEAKQWLLDHGFIQLPPGSYFNWIQSDRFKMYKAVLSFRRGAWIPNAHKLVELGTLDENYRKLDWKEYGGEQIEKEQINSLVETETIQNAKGDTLPF